VGLPIARAGNATMASGDVLGPASELAKLAQLGWG
jgi:hypothetical protein